MALIITDIELPDKEVVRFYGKGWDIEMSRFLNPSYNWGVKSFVAGNSMVAHTSVAFARYIFLSLKRRRSTDARFVR